MRLRTFILFLTLTLSMAGLKLSGGNVTISGTVLDASSLEPVPYATVILQGTERGVLSDELGHYSITTALPFDSIKSSAMGYESATFKAPSLKKSVVKFDIKLKPVGVALNTLTVKPRKEHYSKKNNPAVEFMQRIRATRDDGDPRKTKEAYNYDKYERITLAVNDYHHSTDSSGKEGKFDFVKEYIDTSLLTGKPILNISVREKSSTIHHRKTPESEKEYVHGLRRSGMDEFIDQQSLQKLYEDVMREVDVYQNDINLLQTRFVSPLSRIAPDFYKFYLSDTVRIDSVECVELTFVPRNSSSMGFTGRIYVPKGDSTMFIKKIVLRVPHDINLNFVNNMLIIQEFERDTDGTRLKATDELVMDATLLPGMPGLYTRRKTVYTGHNYTPLKDQSIFNRGLSQIYDAAAYARDDSYWEGNRRAPIAKGEKNMEQMMERFRAVPLFYWGEKLVRIFSKGYIPTGKHSKFDIGPLTSTFSHNEVEGFRLRLGGITTANLSRRWFGRVYGAYGFKDKKWKYGFEAEYSFNDKEYHSREFPVHALRATHLFDMKMLGQSFITNNQDNMFLSWRRAKDVQMLYHRVSKLEYIMELENNFSLTARLQNERMEPTRYMNFINGYGKSFGHYTTNSIKVELRYAPGEKFFQMTTGRLPINFDAPIFTLSHTLAPRGILGNDFGVSTTEASFSKRFWFSAFGYTDILLKGGHTWTQSPYPDLLIPNANLSYFIQLETFPLLNPMEFINDSYLQWDFTYWVNGALFNLIPGFKRLKLREALIFRGLWGHLSDKNKPWIHQQLYQFPAITHTRLMTNTPYMEAGVGIDNVFKVLRIDYTWRLTYRNDPYACREGIRFMFHFSF
ncbi:MAG: DUF5686 and carboxypeptidase regulatory-like domain-containing protein [Muribaculaceae bacterium]|nr:DUF5686 and carboxypeptidase regulatory-like domain-containing protein [Muribaculaceae bacterium]